jgi:hypothetical protein
MRKVSAVAVKMRKVLVVAAKMRKVLVAVKKKVEYTFPLLLEDLDSTFQRM